MENQENEINNAMEKNEENQGANAQINGSGSLFDDKTENGNQSNIESENSANNGDSADGVKTTGGKRAKKLVVVESKAQTKRGRISREGYAVRKNGNSDKNAEKIITDPNAPRLNINDLTNMSIQKLKEEAESMKINLENLNTMKKQDLIFAILKNHTDNIGAIYASGVLDILSDGYGFL
ncbi:MAG TPA: Rho termination factor N-terminal domain-containing protein, partial [Spirochaetota bacterium]|nr:Rho termination factor N-terminal domain-containing protein [Spirochaetota bacterium]